MEEEDLIVGAFSFLTKNKGTPEAFFIAIIVGFFLYSGLTPALFVRGLACHV